MVDEHDHHPLGAVTGAALKEPDLFTRTSLSASATASRWQLNSRTLGIRAENIQRCRISTSSRAPHSSAARVVARSGRVLLVTRKRRPREPVQVQQDTTVSNGMHRVASALCLRLFELVTVKGLMRCFTGGYPTSDWRRLPAPKGLPFAVFTGYVLGVQNVCPKCGRVTGTDWMMMH